MPRQLDDVPETIAGAVREAADRLRASFGDRIHAVRLFGSYARGDAGVGSDVDVLVVLDTIRGPADRSAAMCAVIDVGCAREMTELSGLRNQADYDRHFATDEGSASVHRGKAANILRELDALLHAAGHAGVQS